MEEKKQIKYKTEETIATEGEWAVGEYEYKAWKHHEEFIEGFKQKKIVASICSGCGRVYVPPTYICGRCFRWMNERTVVSDKGVITSFVLSTPMRKGMKILGMDPVEAGIVAEGEVLIPCMVKFYGSDSFIQTILLNVDPKDVKVGMKVQAVWSKKPKGRLSDLEGVEPIK
ncbi:MAG: Zn-ribbon domain-containing OB-fold protein [Candidatus Bathyarchaeia archaeon]